MSNGLDPDQDRHSVDPDQDRHSVGPDLGLNCLQCLSADEKSLVFIHIPVVLTNGSRQLTLLSKDSTWTRVFLPRGVKVIVYIRCKTLIGS